MKKYLFIFHLSFTQALKNYKALIGLSIFLITCLVIFANLWKIAASRQGILNLDPNQLLWYIAFNEWVLISVPDIQDEMEQDLRSGRLAYLLPRPISYLGSVLAEASGAFSVNLIFLGVITFLFTWLQAGSLPFHPIGLIASLFFALLAGITSIFFRMLIGLSGFWLHSVDPLFWIWEKLLFMLGGLMLPLTVYPKWLQTLAHWTPFPSILGDRSALAIDFSLPYVISVFLSLSCWGLFGFLCLLFVYYRGLRILNIEGG